MAPQRSTHLGRSLLAVATALMILAGVDTELARAHGGGLNAAGCHRETATGGYHCHGAAARSNRQVTTQPELWKPQDETRRLWRETKPLGLRKRSWSAPRTRNVEPRTARHLCRSSRSIASCYDRRHHRIVVSRRAIAREVATYMPTEERDREVRRRLRCQVAFHIGQALQATSNPSSLVAHDTMVRLTGDECITGRKEADQRSAEANNLGSDDGDPTTTEKVTSRTPTADRRIRDRRLRPRVSRHEPLTLEDLNDAIATACRLLRICPNGTGHRVEAIRYGQAFPSTHEQANYLESHGHLGFAGVAHVGTTNEIWIDPRPAYRERGTGKLRIRRRPHNEIRDTACHEAAHIALGVREDAHDLTHLQLWYECTCRLEARHQDQDVDWLRKVARTTTDARNEATARRILAAIAPGDRCYRQRAIPEQEADYYERF